MKTPFLKKNNARGQEGFTLIEIMVSVAIFAIVMTISMGAIFTIISNDRKAQAIKSVMNNLDSALEDMTRTIKTGSEYSVTTPCAGAQVDESDTLKVGNAVVDVGTDDGSGDGGGGAPVVYSLTDNHQILKTTGNPGDTNYSSYTVTAPEVTIERMCFYVSGNNPDNTPDNEQPEVLMIIEGYAGTGQTVTHFNLQSSISQRLLDS